jgi:queuine tRNA-ribosyltransferase
MFDCVMPSRNGRHGIVMTHQGKMNLLNAKYINDSRPIEEGCECMACQNYSRAFIRHMINVKDGLGGTLATIHSVHYFVDLMRTIRARIEEGTFFDFARDFLADPKHIFLGGEKDFQAFPEKYV